MMFRESSLFFSSSWIAFSKTMIYWTDQIQNSHASTNVRSNSIGTCNQKNSIVTNPMIKPKQRQAYTEDSVYIFFWVLLSYPMTRSIYIYIAQRSNPPRWPEDIHNAEIKSSIKYLKNKLSTTKLVGRFMLKIVLTTNYSNSNT